MRNIWAIAWKEAKAYYGSPMAYIIGAVFVGITGFFFVDAISVPFPEASVRGFLDRAVVLVMPVWVPVITMRLLAEEQKLGTLELLMTAPVRDYEIVLGKFLATVAIFLGTLAFTLWFVLLLFWFGDPGPPAVAERLRRVHPLWHSSPDGGVAGLLLHRQPGRGCCGGIWPSAPPDHHPGGVRPGGRDHLYRPQ